MSSLQDIDGNALSGSGAIGERGENEPTNNDPIPGLLAKAESLWRSSNIEEAVRDYDAALSIVRKRGDEAMEGQILLGKGFAILNSDASSPGMRKHAMGCLESARDMAATANRPHAVAFVQQLLDREGKMHVEHDSCEHKNGETCEDLKPCSDHNDIGKRVAGRAAELGGDAASFWTEKADEALVELVASQGPRDWGLMVDPILAATENRSSQVNLSASDISSRWEYLRPLLREEFSTGGGMDKERKCGHTCGTCPTRRTCHLHGALVDIEDIGPGSVAPASSVPSKADNVDVDSNAKRPIC